MIKIQLDNKDQYDELALSSAISHIKAVQAFYENVEDPQEFMRDYCQNLNTQKEAKMENHKKWFCEACQKEICGATQIEAHKKTRKHANNESRLKRGGISKKEEN